MERIMILMITANRLKLIMDVVAVVIIAAGAILIYRATPHPGQPARAPTTPPPCATEDGGPIPCSWDGPSRGTPGAPGYRQGDRITITERP